MSDAPVFFAGDAVHDKRLARVQEFLAAEDLGGLLLLKHDAVRYVTGFYAKGYRPFVEFEYLALVRPEGPPLLGTSLAGEEDRARARSRAGEVMRLPGVREWGNALAPVIERLGLERERLAFDLMPTFVRDQLLERFPGMELVDAGGRWSALTAVKLPEEIELLRASQDIAQRGVRAAQEAIAPGVTEIEVSAAGEYEMRRSGSEMNPFIPVVASGTNAALWERVATERRIGDGEMVILDFGCVHRGYTGDVARTVSVGEPSAEQGRLYRAAHLALQEAIAAVRPGVACSAIDALIRRVLADEGYERYCAPWATGHQLGYGLHGAPVLAAGVDEPLLEGMVVNIEPALFTPDAPEVGGVELEDTVVVTETGCDVVTTLPYDAPLLDA